MSGYTQPVLLPVTFGGNSARGGKLSLPPPSLPSLHQPLPCQNTRPLPTSQEHKRSLDCIRDGPVEVSHNAHPSPLQPDLASRPRCYTRSELLAVPPSPPDPDLVSRLRYLRIAAKGQRKRGRRGGRRKQRSITIGQQQLLSPPHVSSSAQPIPSPSLGGNTT
ncbi:hypothetical protein ACOMHN_024052 [Nucella lapillus]